jgi:hypothetical protein
MVRHRRELAVVLAHVVSYRYDRPPPTMSKRTKSKPQERGYVLFDVLYEDGSRASNRRVPVSVLGGIDGDEPARRVIEEQDEAIAAKSGRPRLPIKRLTRSKR